MDGLHATLAALRTETKSEKDHLTVFREFLAQLDQLVRHSVVAFDFQTPPLFSMNENPSPLFISCAGH